MATVLGNLEYLISVDSSKVSSGLNDAEGKVKGFGNKLSSWAVAKGQILGRMVEKAGAATVSFVKGAVSESRGFDKSMSQVAATLGKTTQEVQDLAKFAREMGSKTAFTAQEAAEGLNYMALAGYDAEKSMKMLPQVLNLAAAGNMDLARASDMVTDAQSALGLSIEDTEVMIDQMAKTSSKTNTSVEQLGDAFLTVGGTAKMLKGGTKELSAVLGVLADNGVKGSEGGTALRNVILSLSAPTKKAAQQIKQLGLEVYDADGNMRSLPDIMDDLNSAMSEMTQEERTSIINDIFNKRDLKSVEALLGTNKKRWKELYQEIDNAKGAAQQMADTQLDNLEGDVTKFKSALGEAKLAIVEGLTPSLRKFTQTGTKFIQRITDAFKKDGLTGAIKEAGKIFSNFIQNLKNSDNPVLQTLGKALEGIKTVGQFVFDLFNDFPETVNKLRNSDGFILPLLGTALQFIGNVADAIQTAFEDGIPAAIEKLKTADDPLSNLLGKGLEVLYDVCKFFVDNVGLEGTIIGIASAFALFKTITIASSFLSFLTKLKALGTMKNLGDIATLLKGGDPTVTTPTTTPTTTPVAANTSLKSILKTTLGNFTKLGLTAGVALAPAVLAGVAANLIPDEYKLGKFKRVESAEYTQEDVANLRKWVDLQNQQRDLVEQFSRGETIDENKFVQVADALAALGDIQNTDLGKKFWDYLVANDIEPGKDIIPTDVLEKLGDIEPKPTIEIEPDFTPVEEAEPPELEGEVEEKPDFTAVKEAIPPVLRGTVVYSQAFDRRGYPHSYDVANALGYAKGSWDIGFDQMALLHRGEMVLNKSQARQYRDGGDVDYTVVGEMISGSIERAMGKVYVMMNGDKVGDLTTKRVKRNVNAQSYSRLRAYGG